MAKSPEEQLDRAVADAVELAAAIYGRDIDGVEIDWQVTGEYPYRVRIPDETLPAVGVARAAPSSG